MGILQAEILEWVVIPFSRDNRLLHSSKNSSKPLIHPPYWIINTFYWVTELKPKRQHSTNMIPFMCHSGKGRCSSSGGGWGEGCMHKEIWGELWWWIHDFVHLSENYKPQSVKLTAHEVLKINSIIHNVCGREEKKWSENCNKCI